MIIANSVDLSESIEVRSIRDKYRFVLQLMFSLQAARRSCVPESVVT